MKWVQSFRMALKSIGSNKMRAFLTMLGIIIGVSAVIIMVSLVQGSTKKITDSLQSMGTNLINVSVRGRNSSRVVSVEDMFKLATDNSEQIESVSPSISSSVTLKIGDKNESCQLTGTNEAYETVRNTKVSQGRFISSIDVEERKKVVLIGAYIAQEYFPGVSPVGNNIKLNGDIYNVVGVIEVKSNLTSGSTDDQVIIPYTTAQRLLKNGTISSYAVQAKTAESVDAAMTIIQQFLFKKFNNTTSYNVFNQADMLQRVQDNTQTMTMMMGGIAAISLLVGGIGIMNIMLVSVTERTREIGVRKAIGAKRRNIMGQFLIEAVVVSCMGGLIGVGLGALFSNVIGNALSTPAVASPVVMTLSFGFSVFVGVFFGFYPASKASKLDPIIALRSE